MGSVLILIFLIIFLEYIKQQINEFTLLSFEKVEKKEDSSIFLSQWIYVFIGLIYLFIEIAFLLLTGHSWCNFSGCKLVQSLMGKDENKLVILGNILFLFLLFLEILKLEAKRKEIFFKFPAFNKYNPVLIIEKIEGFFLTLATIIEGFFFATQVFILKDICLFCIGSMFIVLANFIVWCLRNKSNKDLAIGLIGFVSAFYMTAFMVGLLKLNNVNALNKGNSQEKALSFTQINIKNLPCSYLIDNNNKKIFYLFASKTCPHCRNVENFIEKNRDHLNANLKICFINEKQNLEFLRNKNIKFVPVLFSKEGKFLAGGDKDIINFLKKFIKKNISYNPINGKKADNNKINQVDISIDSNQDINNLFKNTPVCTFNSSCE